MNRHQLHEAVRQQLDEGDYSESVWRGFRPLRQQFERRSDIDSSFKDDVLDGALSARDIFTTFTDIMDGSVGPSSPSWKHYVRDMEKSLTVLRNAVIMMKRA